MEDHERETTSLRIRKGTWKSAKILAIEEGKTLSALIEELLESAIHGAEVAKRFPSGNQGELLELLRSKRQKGEMPLMIVHEKAAVELVKEGRGE